MHAAAPVLCDVLVVEDDHDTRDVMVGLLRRAGCDGRAAASAGEALLQIEGSLPTHILLDLMLPDAGGVVVLRAIRRRQLPVRVAVLTAAGRAIRGCDGSAAVGPGGRLLQANPFRRDRNVAGAAAVRRTSRTRLSKQNRPRQVGVLRRARGRKK